MLGEAGRFAVSKAKLLLCKTNNASLRLAVSFGVTRRYAELPDASPSCRSAGFFSVKRARYLSILFLFCIFAT